MRANVTHDGAPASGTGGVRTILTASGALTTAMLPVFLLGALTGPVGDDLRLDEEAIGGAVTLLFVVAGVAATPVGRVTERIGAGRALRSGVVVTGLATAAIGLASSWWHLAVALAVVGVAVGLIDTGAARAFSEGVSPTRQGTAFGLKEASVPSASLLAGLALPTLAAALGWRGAFVAASGVAVAVLLLLPRRRTIGAPAATAAPRVPPPAASAPTTRLVRFAVGVGLGAGAATAAATFLVPALMSRGLSPTAAGLTLAAASVASISARIVSGRWADREDRPTVASVALFLGIGASGAAVLVSPAPPVVAAVAALTVLGGGWGWTGLAFVSVVRAHRGAPAVAAGVVLTGLGIGGASGPLAFGALANRMSYAAAWIATAAALGIAAAIVTTARR